MDLRNANKEIQIREMINRAMFGLNTAIPGIIKSFDSSRQTVSVVPAIKVRTYIDGEEAFIEIDPIVEVPLVYPIAVTNGFAMTLPVTEGDSCLLIFSQRAIDNWHDLGGVQPPEDGVSSRHHSLTDAFAVMAPSATPDALANWESDGIEIRNRNKSMRATFKDDSIVLVVDGTTLTLDSSGLTVNNSIVSETSIEDPKGTMEEMRGVYNNHDHVETGSTTNPPADQMT